MIDRAPINIEDKAYVLDYAMRLCFKNPEYSGFDVFRYFSEQHEIADCISSAPKTMLDLILFLLSKHKVNPAKAVELGFPMFNNGCILFLETLESHLMQKFPSYGLNNYVRNCIKSVLEKMR